MDSKAFEVFKALTGRQEVLEILAMLVSLVPLVSLATRAVVEKLVKREPWVTLEVLGVLDHLVSQVLLAILDKLDLLVRQTETICSLSICLH